MMTVDAIEPPVELSDHRNESRIGVIVSSAEPGACSEEPSDVGHPDLDGNHETERENSMSLHNESLRPLQIESRSSSTSLSTQLKELHDQKVDAKELRQKILAPSLSNHSALLSKLSQLEGKIQAAVEAIRKKTETLRDASGNGDLAEGENNVICGECDKYQEENHSLRLRLEELQSKFEDSLEQNDSLATEVLRLDSILKEIERASHIVARELEMAAEDKAVRDRQQQKTRRQIFRLENTIELLVEDNRNATEKLVDAEDALLHAARYKNDEIVSQHLSQLEGEKKTLEKEVQKMNKEKILAMDRMNFVTQQHERVVERLKKNLQNSRQQVEMLQKSNTELSSDKLDATTALTDLTTRYEKLTEDLERSLAKNVEFGIEKLEERESAQKLNIELKALKKEKDDTVSSLNDLTARCDKLARDLECSTSKIVELEAAKVTSEESSKKLENDIDKLGIEKVSLEERVGELSAANEKLVEQQADAKATIKRLSDEVLFTHEEISRLSMEKDAIVEESEQILQEASNRLDELTKENEQKSKQYQELWTRSNASLLEKESAVATVEQLQQEKEKSKGDSKEEEELKARIEMLQKENEQHRQAAGLLREMNELLESEKEVAVEFVKRDLELQNEELRLEIDVLQKTCISEKQNAELENESLRKEMLALKKAHDAEKESVQRENENLRKEMDALKNSFASKREQMKSEEEDLKWKVDALQQNMNLRLKEKDSIIAQLETHVQDCHNETAMLRKEIHQRDDETRSDESKANLVAMIEEQQIELEQKDVLISDLRTEETRYKADILRMQSKVERMEQWLHDSLSFTSPPQSPRKRISNPQSPSIPQSPVQRYSNPQTPTKESFK